MSMCVFFLCRSLRETLLLQIAVCPVCRGHLRRDVEFESLEDAAKQAEENERKARKEQRRVS